MDGRETTCGSQSCLAQWAHGAAVSCAGAVDPDRRQEVVTCSASLQGELSFSVAGYHMGKYSDNNTLFLLIPSQANFSSPCRLLSTILTVAFV